MKHLKSLREYIDALKEIGEIQEINQEVDWNLELGAIARRCYETGLPKSTLRQSRTEDRRTGGFHWNTIVC